MSSHHIVRESQEPALLILQPDHLACPHMGPLLEWSPSIVVMGNAIQEVSRSGIKIDVVVFPESQKDKIEEQVHDQSPVSLIPVKEEKDLLLMALHFLAQKGQQAVNVLIRSAAKDQMLLSVLEDQMIIKNVVLMDEKEKWALCRSGSFQKWFPAHELISILSSPGEALLTTTGFTENLSGTKFQGLKTFRTLQAGTITFNSTSPFWLIEQLY